MAKKLSLNPYVLGAVCLTALLIALSANHFYKSRVLKQSHEQLTIATTDILRQRANQIASKVNEQQSRIDTFAERSALGSVLNRPSKSLLQTVADGLKEAFPEALSLRLFDLNRRDLLNPIDAQAKLSFIELDLINKTEQGERAAPELIRTNSEDNNDWQLIFVAPIERDISEDDADSISLADAHIAGTLMVTFSGRHLQDALNGFDHSRGRTQMQSQIENKTINFFQRGQGLAELTQKQSVRGSPWQIVFSPSEQLRQEHRANPNMLIIIHAALALILLPAVGFAAKRFVPKALNDSPEQHSAALVDTHIDNIDIAEEDKDVLDLQESSPLQAQEKPTQSSQDFDPTIFRTYDIRGHASEQLSAELARRIGRAIASEVIDQGGSSVFVGRDGRLSSESFYQALIEGVLSSGCDVVKLGLVPTPLVYYACYSAEPASGIMITASHNGPEFNGFKIVINGNTLVGNQIEGIRDRIEHNEVHSGQGSESERDILPEYIDRILNDVAIAGELKVVIDAGNGAASETAPALFEALGCEVVPLFCEIDGNFPNHNPDPTREENLQALLAKVVEEGADLGIALDGDGDRLVITTPAGEIVWPDRILMLFAKDIVTRNPGCDVVFDVKCSRSLSNVISSYGGRPVMWKSGHSNIKAKMREIGALLGGEFTGHLFIKDRWYGFDDAMYSAARLLEIITLRDQPVDELFEHFPVLPSTNEILVNVDESDKFKLIEDLVAEGDFRSGEKNTLDGLRIEFEKGWALVRASNTSAAITLRFEGESIQIISQMQALVKQQLQKVRQDISLPF